MYLIQLRSDEMCKKISLKILQSHAPRGHIFTISKICQDCHFNFNMPQIAGQKGTYHAAICHILEPDMWHIAAWLAGLLKLRVLKMLFFKVKMRLKHSYVLHSLCYDALCC